MTDETNIADWRTRDMLKRELSEAERRWDSKLDDVRERVVRLEKADETQDDKIVTLFNLHNDSTKTAERPVVKNQDGMSNMAKAIYAGAGTLILAMLAAATQLFGG